MNFSLCYVFVHLRLPNSVFRTFPATDFEHIPNFDFRRSFSTFRVNLEQACPSFFSGARGGDFDDEENESFGDAILASEDGEAGSRTSNLPEGSSVEFGNFSRLGKRRPLLLFRRRREFREVPGPQREVPERQREGAGRGGGGRVARHVLDVVPAWRLCTWAPFGARCCAATCPSTSRRSRLGSPAPTSARATPAGSAKAHPRSFLPGRNSGELLERNAEKSESQVCGRSLCRRRGNGVPNTRYCVEGIESVFERVRRTVATTFRLASQSTEDG